MVLDREPSIEGFRLERGFSVSLQDCRVKSEQDVTAKECVWLLMVCRLPAASGLSELHVSGATGVESTASQNILVDGFGVCEFLGLGAIVGGGDLAGCGCRRGRGRGSSLFLSKSPLLLLPSETGCCSKAWILAFRVAMS